MNQARVKAWRAIEQETAELLALAKAHDWTALATRQAARQERLEAFFVEPVEDELADVVRAGIEVVRRVDERISDLIRNSRDQTEHELSRFRASRHAVDTYAATP